MTLDISKNQWRSTGGEAGCGMVGLGFVNEQISSAVVRIVMVSVFRPDTFDDLLFDRDFNV